MGAQDTAEGVWWTREKTQELARGCSFASRLHLPEVGWSSKKPLLQRPVGAAEAEYVRS